MNSLNIDILDRNKKNKNTIKLNLFKDIFIIVE
jgi:hypothetical protein